ncbi:MAG: OmpA family protein [Owenweeksia sp.]
MTRYLLIFILGVVFYYPGSAVETQRLVVLFDSDKHELTEIAQNALYDFISEIDPGSDFELEIMGHTDDIGNLSYNDALSEKRSLAVREYLLKAGIESKLIRTYSFGERKPEKPNIDDTHRNMNRRVELVLTNYSFKDLSELEKTLSREGSNYFTLDPSEPAIIKGREGVSMLIEANSFVNKQGETVKEPVKVTLTEALNFEDYIGHNLTTLSGDRMLVSGGMLQVTAQTANGDTLNLAPGKAITTAVTVPRTEEGMQLFTSNTGSSWDISETRVTSGLELDLPPYPRFNFRSYSLPIYNRDFSSKPEKPEFRGQPKPPKAPDPLDYEPEIEWYQFLFAEKIKREAHERYMGVMQKHEEKVTFYHRRYELYEEHNSDMPEKLARYKKDLIAWDKQCKEDSISFLSSTEYLELKNKNLLLLSQAREKYDEEVRWTPWELPVRRL